MKEIESLEYDNKGNIFISRGEGENKEYYLVAECVSERWSKLFVNCSKIVNNIKKEYNE